MNKAYNLGWDAAKHNYSLMCNPYRAGSLESSEWLRGYEASREHYCHYLAGTVIPEHLRNT